jgi:hypothetical protein
MCFYNLKSNRIVKPLSLAPAKRKRISPAGSRKIRMLVLTVLFLTLFIQHIALLCPVLHYRTDSGYKCIHDWRSISAEEFKVLAISRFDVPQKHVLAVGLNRKGIAKK